MKSHDNPNNDWDACPAGTLRGLASRQRQRQRAHRMQQLAIPATVAVLFLLIGVTARNFISGSSDHAGGISCQHVAENINAYASGALDAILTGQIDQHMGDCPKCKAKLDQMQKADDVGGLVDSESVAMSEPAAATAHEKTIARTQDLSQAIAIVVR